MSHACGGPPHVPAIEHRACGRRGGRPTQVTGGIQVRVLRAALSLESCHRTRTDTHIVRHSARLHCTLFIECSNCISRGGDLHASSARSFLRVESAATCFPAVHRMNHHAQRQPQLFYELRSRRHVFGDECSGIGKLLRCCTRMV